MVGLTLIDGKSRAADPLFDYINRSGLPPFAIVSALFDQSDDCIKIVDPNGHLQHMNCNGMQAMEIEDFDAIRGAPWSSLWPEESRDSVEQSLSVARKGGQSRFEAFCPTAKGSPRWWEVTVSPVTAQGRVVAVLASSRDISERIARQDALETIAAEMKHRLHNAFTIGAALSLAMTKDQPDHREFALDFASRLIRLAELQTSLVDAHDAALGDVIGRVIASFDDAGKLVKVGAMPDVRLDEQQAKALFLVLGELTTNSLKYGALSGRGTVAIDADQCDGSLRLTWNEAHCSAGQSVSSSRIPGGAGNALMHKMLTTIGGQFSTAASDGGYHATISMRIDDRP